MVAQGVLLHGGLDMRLTLLDLYVSLITSPLYLGIPPRSTDETMVVLHKAEVGDSPDRQKREPRRVDKRNDSPLREYR
jgi:hypothetical protein